MIAAMVQTMKVYALFAGVGAGFARRWPARAAGGAGRSE